MEKLSLLDLVKKYIDDEKKRQERDLSITKQNNRRSAWSTAKRNKWIIGDVNDEITAINDEFNLIIENNDAQVKKIFTHLICSQYKTVSYIDFLFNTSKPFETYYKKLLKKCLINNDTINAFLNPENHSEPNPKTIDFFTAFCKHQ